MENGLPIEIDLHSWQSLIMLAIPFSLHSNRIANRTAKNGYRHIWLRADTLAPSKDSEVVRKYWQILRATPKSDREP